MQSQGKAHPSKVVSEVTSVDLQDGVGEETPARFTTIPAPSSFLLTSRACESGLTPILLTSVESSTSVGMVFNYVCYPITAWKKKEKEKKKKKKTKKSSMATAPGSRVSARVCVTYTAHGFNL
jgi:hypothetical protein